MISLIENIDIQKNKLIIIKSFEDPITIFIFALDNQNLIRDNGKINSFVFSINTSSNIELNKEYNIEEDAGIGHHSFEWWSKSAGKKLIGSYSSKGIISKDENSTFQFTTNLINGRFILFKHGLFGNICLKKISEQN